MKILILNASPRAKEICHYSGFKIVATIEKGGTRHNTAITEKEKRKCIKAVRKLKDARKKFKKKHIQGLGFGKVACYKDV